MSRSEFIVTEIPGPESLKLVLRRLDYSKEQISVADALVKPLEFPVYVYQNPDTRYWYGGPAEPAHGKKLNWREFLASFGHDEGLIANAIESDARWFNSKLRDSVIKLTEITGAPNGR